MRDAKVWEIAAPEIILNIEASNYYVIVPSKEVQDFRKISPSNYQVLSEDDLLPVNISDLINKYLPDDFKYRRGWYLQQLIKISALNFISAGSEDLMLIWDADTIPLRKLKFFQENRVLYFMGEEHHPPYFNSIQKLLNIEKQVNFSFIAQCFIFKKKWAREFIDEIETLHHESWIQVILEKSDLANPSGFSEYETLGNWLMARHRSEIAFNPGKWERFGSSRCGLKNYSQYGLNHPKCNYISFESWDGYTGDKNLVQMSTLGKNGRFGNQIFQYFFLRLVEKELGFEVRCPGWMGDKVFDLGKSEALLSTAFPIDWSIVSKKTDTPELDISRIQDLMVLNKTNSLDISGYFHYHTKYLQKYKNLFLETFKFNADLILEIQKRIKNIGATQLIAIHVRAGDYVALEKLNNGFGFTITPSFSEINIAIKNLLSTNKGSQALIYLASDDLEYASQGLKPFNIECITSKDLFPLASSPYPDLSLDFCVLALADILLISNSSYSFSAAMLNQIGKTFLRPNINTKKYEVFDPWDDYILHSRSRTLYI